MQTLFITIDMKQLCTVIEIDFLFVFVEVTSIATSDSLALHKEYKNQNLPVSYIHNEGTFP